MTFTWLQTRFRKFLAFAIEWCLFVYVGVHVDEYLLVVSEMYLNVCWCKSAWTVDEKMEVVSWRTSEKSTDDMYVVTL